jgi:hypothetical protein
LKSTLRNHAELSIIHKAMLRTTGASCIMLQTPVTEFKIPGPSFRSQRMTGHAHQLETRAQKDHTKPNRRDGGMKRT